MKYFSYFSNLLKNLDKTLLLLPLLFAAISIVMIASTSFKGEFVFSRPVRIQTLSYGLGFVALFVVLFIDYHAYIAREKLLYAASLIALLSVYLPGIGWTEMGSTRWINLGITTFQPSEIVKIALVVLLAIYLSRNQHTLGTVKGAACAFLYAAPFILIVLKEDLGSAIGMGVIWITMVFYAGLSYKLCAWFAAAVVLFVPLSYRFLGETQRNRIDAFLNPNNLSLPGNYHVWQSKIAIGSGGLFGKGLFAGTQKELDFLPVQRSDFIFSVIVEELGFVGGLAVILLYVVFLYRLVKIARNAKDTYGALIAVGFIGMFLFQVFENIAMTMGLMPVTGITLPFISYGGSSVLSCMIAVGLVLNVGIRSKTINF